MSADGQTWTLPSNDSPVWLYGPRTDLLVGYGLGYLLFVPLLLAFALMPGEASGVLWVGPAVGLATATPHYGATLLRVYEERAERRKYAVFAVWITAILVVLFFAGHYVPVLGSLLLTIYVSWSPWHFAGQNYGLGVMYMRRAGGGDIDPLAKRFFYSSFVLSAVLSFLVVHTADSGLVFAQGASDDSQTFTVLRLGVPPAFAKPLASLLFAAYVAALAGFAWRLRSRFTLAGLLPVLCLVSVQSLWFIVPALATAFDQGNVRHLLPFTAITISAAHSLQYLWVTSHYAGVSTQPSRRWPFLAKCLLGGGAVLVPGLLFVPGLFADWAPYAAGTVVLTFSLVNIHHFILDGAVWKLRDGRVARALLRSDRSDDREAPRLGWVKPVLLAIGVVGVGTKVLVIGLAAQVEGFEGDPRTLYHQCRVLGWLGHTRPHLWSQMADVLEKDGAVDEAIDAWQRSLTEEPWPVVSANRLAWLLVNHRTDDPASVAQATELGEYLVRTMGASRAEGLQTLAAAHMAAGRVDAGVRTAQQALAVARANGNPMRIRQVKSQVDAYRRQKRPGAAGE